MGQGDLPLEQATRPSPELSPRLLRSLAGEMQLELEPQQCEQLLGYVALLLRWNRVHNLTAIADAEGILTHHLLDSLAIVAPLERALARYAGGLPRGSPLHFLDAGSGAGLPGIPLCVARPHWQGTLVDAVQKKCAFLHQARIELHLGNVTVRHARLESSGLAPHELVVSRAFASLREFVRRTQDLLHPRGLWAAMKGRNPAREEADLPAAVEVLETITLRVPMLREERHLVILRHKAAAAIGSAARNP